MPQAVIASPVCLPPEPVLETLKRDVLRVVTNLRTVVFPFGATQSSLRDWDLWGPFFFIIFLALVLSSAASTNKVGPGSMDVGHVCAQSLGPNNRQQLEVALRKLLCGVATSIDSLPTPL